MEEFYTVKQAAIVLKIHQITIRRYIREGRLKAYRAGGNIRIALADLMAFTQTFVPKTRNPKEIIRSSSEANFSLSDPLFRLKARGLGLSSTEQKGR